jgi:hypothetical protein
MIFQGTLQMRNILTPITVAVIGAFGLILGSCSEERNKTDPTLTTVDYVDPNVSRVMMYYQDQLKMNLVQSVPTRIMMDQIGEVAVTIPQGALDRVEAETLAIARSNGIEKFKVSRALVIRLDGMESVAEISPIRERMEFVSPASPKRIAWKVRPLKTDSFTLDTTVNTTVLIDGKEFELPASTGSFVVAVDSSRWQKISEWWNSHKALVDIIQVVVAVAALSWLGSMALRIWNASGAIFAKAGDGFRRLKGHIAGIRRHP